VSSKAPREHWQSSDTVTGWFLIAYFFGLWAFRMSTRGLQVGFMEQLWMCNATLLLAGVALLVRSSRLFAVCVAAIALAHIAWYLDVFAYLAIGKMPFGRATYMLWPDATVWQNLTSLHHAWQLPLSLPILRRVGGLPWRAGTLDFSRYVLLLTSLSALTPREVDGHYININMAHEFWKDSHVAFFHSVDPPPLGDKPYWVYFLFLNTWGVYFFNFAFFVPLKLFVDFLGPAKVTTTTNKRD
jgi:hypothetical protein